MAEQRIHPTAIVHPSVELGEGVEVGPYAIIEEDVVIGDGTKVAAHALIARGSRVGRQCQIHFSAVVGTIPQDLKFEGEETTLEIGDRTVVREFCTLNRGTKQSGKTVIGSDCLLMAYAHVAHDCVVGDRSVLANGVQLGGHVLVDHDAGIGGWTPAHQFTRIGQYAFVGGGYRIVKDVPPFILAAGEPLRYYGPNLVGLRRRGFSAERIAAIARAYRLIYRSGLNVRQALRRIPEEMEVTDDIRAIIDFIESSERGIIGG
ncbi:MAG: acyl-ACP--UDP-N-acetylglucosamine O-acyltransferase [candidate division KSB1 bacterium]|nr:acyl-ACP--UDP-N-acetylglucosamine O-acyltransferase [candidate division KSB1 bacterium]